MSRAIGEVHVDFTAAELAAAKAALRRHGTEAPTDRQARKVLAAWAKVAFAKAVELEAKLERQALRRGAAELRYAARGALDRVVDGIDAKKTGRELDRLIKQTKAAVAAGEEA